MTKSVASIGKNESLSAAAQLMWDCDCGAIPVLDEEGKVIGMVTDRDICMATWSRDASPSTVHVEAAMSRELYACSPNDTLASAESIMRSRQVRRIPVLDAERRLLGILSLADIARRGEASGARGSSNELAADRIAVTLANICETPSNGATTASAAR